MVQHVNGYPLQSFMKRTITETAPDDLCVLYRLLLPFQNCLGVLCFEAFCLDHRVLQLGPIFLSSCLESIV